MTTPPPARPAAPPPPQKPQSQSQSQSRPKSQSRKTQPQTPAAGIIEQARRFGGYEQASRLAQRNDEDWIAAAVPARLGSLLDLGCGTGSLLARLIADRPGLHTVYGLDRSADRIASARRGIDALGAPVRTELLVGDLTEPPDLPGGFDAALLTHVLHWLHPHEERVFGWVARLLAPKGAFVLTSHHPPTAADGLGGTDEVVREALHLLDVPAEDVRPLFDRAGIVPFGTRTLEPGEVADRLRPYFAVETVHERRAQIRVASGTEYAGFHAATFGDSYSRLAGADREEEFFRALATVAERRMRATGIVNGHPVRLWRCTPHGGAR